MNDRGGSPEGRSTFLGKEARVRWKEAEILLKHEHYEAACGRSWTSATYGLVGFLHRAGAGASVDYCDDLLVLGVQVGKRIPRPSDKKKFDEFQKKFDEFQEAIWQLSAYREEPLAERVAPRNYDDADAERALGAAEVVLDQVDEWMGQAKQGAGDPASL